MGHIALMETMQNSGTILIRRSKGRGHFRYVGVDGRILLK